MGKGDYRVYNLNLTIDPKSSNSNLFNVAQPTTPWVYVDGKGTNRDFRNFVNAPNWVNINIDSNIEDEYMNHFIVKVKSGAELEGKTGVDTEPSESFTLRNATNGIEDVVVAGRALRSALFSVGDVVHKSVSFTGDQLLFCSNWTPINNVSWIDYFICDPNEGDFEEGKGAANLNKYSELQPILYQFYRAVSYKVFNPDEKYQLYADKSNESELTEEEYNAYHEMLDKLYSYIKDRIIVDKTNKSITAKLSGKTYKMTLSDNMYTYKEIADVADLKEINIVTYSDLPDYVDRFSKEQSRTFGLKGLSSRYRLRYSLWNDMVGTHGFMY